MLEACLRHALTSGMLEKEARKKSATKVFFGKGVLTITKDIGEGAFGSVCFAEYKSKSQEVRERRHVAGNHMLLLVILGISLL